MDVRFISATIIGGVGVTLLTGLFPNTRPMLLGATHHGYPFAWLIRLIIAPQYFPWRINELNLILDIIFWSAIIGLIMYVFMSWRH